MARYFISFDVDCSAYKLVTVAVLTTLTTFPGGPYRDFPIDIAGFVSFVNAGTRFVYTNSN